MLPLPSMPDIRLPVSLAAVLLALLLASPAVAIPATATLDPTQSTLDGAPLSGEIALDVGAGSPASSRSFDVTGLAVSGAGLSIGLDDRLANPGLGVLRADGSFLIPALFVVVDGLDDLLLLTLIDVAGTFGDSAACGGAPCLETAFTIDTGGPEGTLDVAITAIVPEPGTGLLVAVGLTTMAVARRRRIAR